VRASVASPAGCRTVPERVCQAEAVFLRVAAYRQRQAYVPCSSSSSVAMNRVLPVVTFSGFVPVVVATGSCNRSFLARLLPTHSFARYRSRVSRAALPGSGPRQMRTYLVRIPHRQGHSIQSDVLLASAIAGPNRRIHGPTRVGPNGRDLELPHGNSDRTTGPKLGSSSLLSGLSSSTAPSGRLQYL
jgi:hypothetical protein